MDPADTAGVDSRHTRVPVRRVEWGMDAAAARWYLLSLVFAVPGYVLGFVLAATGLFGLLIVLLVPVTLVYFIQLDLLMDATHKHRRAYLGFWALRAQLWLLVGGATSQAVRVLQRSRRAKLDAAG